MIHRLGSASPVSAASPVRQPEALVGAADSAAQLVMLDSAAGDLAKNAGQLLQSPVADRIALAEACLEGVFRHAAEWVETCCNDKRIALGSRCQAEEIMLGPLIVARQLRLTIHTLRNLQRYGRPQLPGAPKCGADGRLRVPVLPVQGMFDSLMYPGFRADAWMQPGVDGDNLFLPPPDQGQRPAVCLVLGGGNVSAIPATDAFGKILQEGQAVLLKMHPVNQGLGPIFASAFQPLVDRGFLRIVYGGAEVGSQGVTHPLVDNVHITGSIETHDRIVWGAPDGESSTRRRQASPLLNKPITSELGNVSPWIVVPGKYSARQLAFQAENVAASIIHNAGFACASTRVIITWEHWPQREQFLDLVQQVFDRTPQRVAFYPGALDRYRQFTGRTGNFDGDKLPWTLIRGVDPSQPSPLLAKESFVCICADVALGGGTPVDFLQRATDFANEKLWGTLCATLTIPPQFRRHARQEAELQGCLRRLRYGCVGINQWPGLMYGLVSPAWGGSPDATLADAQSGLGWVHNTYQLRGIEKTVMEGPLTFSPKPLWFPSHAAPEPVAWAALELYRRSSLTDLPGLMFHAFKGHLLS